MTSSFEDVLPPHKNKLSITVSMHGTGFLEFNKMETKVRQEVQTSSNQLSCLYAIRGLGAVWILSYHISHTQPGPIGLRYFVTLPFDFAYLAWLFFVVISGFCIHLNAARNISLTGSLKQNWPVFWKRRVHRLYPPYLFAIVFSLILRELVSANAVIPERSPIILDLVVHLVMIQNLIPQFLPGLGNPPLWTLGLEEQLYALYAPLVRLRTRFSIEKVSVIVLLVGLVWVIFLTPLTGSSGRTDLWWLFWPFTYWFAWTVGAFAAEIYVGTVSYNPIWHSLPLAVALLSVGVMTSYPVLGLFIKTNFFISHFGTGSLTLICRTLVNTSNFIFAGSFFILINLLVSAEKRGTLYAIPRFFPWLGLFSYSFYLTHEPIVRLIESYLPKGTSAAETILRYVLIVPICIAIGWLFFHLIEKRYLNTKQTDDNKRANANVG